MGRSVIKDQDFFNWRTALLDETVVFENCKFNHAYFVFNSDIKYVAFKNCVFSASSSLAFVFFDGVVRFEHCYFRSGTTFRGSIDKKGKVKFIKCDGLTETQFVGLRNCSQTLSEMGLYQTFKNYALSTRKEETVYKKIGIFYPRYSWRLDFVGFAIATLTIPKGVIRYGNRNDKCRCEKAIVTDIEMYGVTILSVSELFADKPSSFRCGSIRDDGVTVYEVGKEVKPNYFDYIPNKCSYGIHYFYDRKLAEEYDFS